MNPDHDKKNYGSFGKMGSEPGFDIFVFQSCIAVINWNFLCRLALNKLKVSSDYNNYA